MSDLKETPAPLFGCQHSYGCAESVSYEADMLRVYDGILICEGCYAEDILEDGAGLWSDLPAFVYISPLQDKLAAALEEATAILDGPTSIPFPKSLAVGMIVTANRALIAQARAKGE